MRRRREGARKGVRNRAREMSNGGSKGGAREEPCREGEREQGSKGGRDI